MDYEKAYNDALARAKAWVENRCMPSDTNRQGVLEDIFPELKEPKDEKVRKALIEMVHDTTGDELWVDYNVHKEEALSWLEKQGASIDVDSILNKVGIKPAYKDGNAWCILYGDNIQDGICGFGDTKEDTLVAFIKELLEKQGETITKRDVDNAYLKGISDARNELEKQGEQKPAWNEEDEHRAKDTIYFLDTANKHYASTVELDACIDWLNSLKERIGG